MWTKRAKWKPSKSDFQFEGVDRTDKTAKIPPPVKNGKERTILYRRKKGGKSFDLPDFGLPDFDLPDLGLPDFNLPEVKLPRLDIAMPPPLEIDFSGLTPAQNAQKTSPGQKLIPPAPTNPRQNAP